MYNILYLSIILQTTISINLLGVTLTGIGVIGSWVWIVFAIKRTSKKDIDNKLQLKLNTDVFEEHKENNSIQFESFKTMQTAQERKLNHISDRTDAIYEILAK